MSDVYIIQESPSPELCKSVSLQLPILKPNTHQAEEHANCLMPET